MGLGQWLRPPRRTLTVFIAMTLALSVALGVSAWWLVRLDGAAGGQRAQVRLERDVHLIAISLRNRLNEIDLELASLEAAGSRATEARSISWVGPASVVAFIEASRVNAWPADRLAYYPDPATLPETPGAGLRAATLISEARVLREQGRAAASLAVYEQLAKVDARVLNDTPAELVARHARASVLQDLGRADDAAREAATMLTSLRGRPWRLSAGTYSYYAAQAALWISVVPAAIEPFPDRREALALAVTQLWDESHRTSLVPSSDRRVLWIDRHPLVIVSRTSPAGTVAFVGSTADVAGEVLNHGQPAGSAPIDLALVDTSGRATFGRLPPPSADRIVSMDDEAGLPWSIYAAASPVSANDEGRSFRRAAILSSAGLVALCALAGGWFAARAMHRELEVARVQTDFVSAVSHEFRTPLAAFEQLSELLVDGRVETEGDRNEYYRRLHRESRRLRRLVEDLLDFRRMEAGAREYRLEPADLSAIVRDVAAEFVAERPGREDLLRITMASSLPTVRADRESVGRAFWNLLDNATKYAPGSAILVTTDVVNGTVRVSVRDEGPGIAPNRHEDIFREFVRVAGNDTRAVAGTGLGLTMVRRIAEAHGGRATVDSAVGQGATFTIELPARQSQES